MDFSPTKRAAEMLSGEIASEHDLLDQLGRMIETEGTRKAVAASLGISGAFLHDVMRGSRGIGGIHTLLGWERVVVYRKK